MTVHDAAPSEGPLAGLPYLPLEDLAWGDPTMNAVIAYGKRFIDRGLPILVLGETGTGKEYLARALHDYSERRRAALVAVNCASIPESLIESELYGYSKGAFSGALPGGMRGKVVQAHQGTLFLDEIGDMPAAHQTRLLRVLSEREVTPLGATQATPVDVQLICATHQDLLECVDNGTFREDLYYRIAVGTLRLPALRERSDLKELIMRMIGDEWPEVDPAQAIHRDALELLSLHEWPGNLRQLRSAIRYACAVAPDLFINVSELPVELMRPRRRSPLGGMTLAPLPLPSVPAADKASGLDQERGEVLRALTAARWNISAAARSLGMCRASLYRKLKSLEIPHLRDCGPELMDARDANAGFGRLNAIH